MTLNAILGGAWSDECPVVASGACRVTRTAESDECPVADSGACRVTRTAESDECPVVAVGPVV